MGSWQSLIGATTEEQQMGEFSINSSYTYKASNYEVTITFTFAACLKFREQKCGIIQSVYS